MDRLEAAVEAVARRYAGTWDAGGRYLTVAAKRIAIEVVALEPVAALGADIAKPRLRFDRVALRVVGRLQAALSPVVPDGAAVALTITAPIRLAAKTTAALETEIRDGLAQRPARVDIDETIHGNRVRARLLRGVPGRASKVIGFVHNPETDANLLLGLTQSLLQAIGAADKASPGTLTGERWLILADAVGVAPIDTLRQVHAQLGLSTDFAAILVARADARVDVLAGPASG